MRGILDIDGTLDTLYLAIAIAIAVAVAHAKETEIKRYHQLLHSYFFVDESHNVKAHINSYTFDPICTMYMVLACVWADRMYNIYSGLL